MSDDRNRELILKAKMMRNLSSVERAGLISKAENCLDARARFEFRMKQVAMARAYRKPIKPKGRA